MNIIINPMSSRFAKIDSRDKMRGIGNYLGDKRNIQNGYQDK
jgi:hypothetical protein